MRTEEPCTCLGCCTWRLAVRVVVGALLGLAVIVVLHRAGDRRQDELLIDNSSTGAAIPADPVALPADLQVCGKRRPKLVPHHPWQPIDRAAPDERTFA